MPRKSMSDEEKKAFGAKMKAARAAKKLNNPTEEAAFDKTDFQEPELSLAELMRQMKEVQETNELLKAAVLAKGPTQGQAGIQGNRLVGEVNKYLIDPSNYPDPTPRLAKEPRLKAVNFDYNYELEYKFVLPPSYETKAGLNMREPRFIIQLNRVVLDDQGERTDKRYIARRLVFHEDPQAALVVANDNGILVDSMDEKTFLDEMRYLRTRDWLFGYFWPKPAVEAERIQEEVIGGTIVQVFTKSSEESSSIDFDKLESKLTV